MTPSVVDPDARRGQISNTRSGLIVSGGFRRFYVINAIGISDSREQKLYGWYIHFI